MEKLYTTEQAAQVLQVSVITIRRYIKQGNLKAYKAGGNVRISQNDLKLFTQNFTPKPKKVKIKLSASSSIFTYTDPLLNLKGRGIGQ